MAENDAGNGADENPTQEDSGQGSPEDKSEMSGMPIFYEKPEILDSERHKNLGLIESASFSFASTSNAIPINASEFPAAARDYPVVFIGEDEVNSVAIVGLRKGENLMVDAEEKWAQGTYIPAYVRRYPFIFVRQDGGTQYALCIDRASNRIGSDADRMFFDDSKMTELSEKAMEFCTLFQRHFLATEVIVKQLIEFDLLVTHQVQFSLANGSTLTLKDFKVVDESRLNDLGEADFISLRKTGALGAIYSHLISLNSWQHLLMRVST